MAYNKQKLLRFKETIFKSVEFEIMKIKEKYEFKQKHKIPLIVKIPDRHGNAKISETIEEYIQKSVGLKF